MRSSLPNTNRLSRKQYFEVFALLPLLFLCSCFERPQLDSMQLMKGNSHTVVSDAALDSKGNVIIVGETFATNLASPGTLQSEFGSTRNIQYFNPAAMRFQEAAVTPFKRPAAMRSAGGARESLFLFNGTEAYRNAGNRWERLSFNQDPPDTVQTSFVWASQATVYAKIFKHYEIDPNRHPYALSRDEGASWQELKVFWDANRYDSPGIVIDPLNPCRIVAGDARTRSTDCGLTWQTVAKPGVQGVLSYDARGGGRWLGINYVAGAVDFALYESRDAGESWRQFAVVPLTFLDLVGDPSDDAEFLSSGADGIYRSSGRVSKWTLIYPFTRFAPISTASMAVLNDPGYPNLYLVGNGKISPQIYDSPFLAYSPDGFRTVKVLIPPTLVTMGFGRYFTVALGPGGGLYVQHDPQPDAFVAKFDPSGRQIFFTYLGGEDSDSATSVSVDGDDNIIVGGRSQSKSFPSTHSIGIDPLGFVAKFSPDGSRLLWSTRIPAQVDLGVPVLPVLVECVKGGSIYVASGGTTSSYLLRLGPDGRTAEFSSDLAEVGTFRSMKVDSKGDIVFGTRGGISRFSVATRTSERIAALPGIDVSRLRIHPDGSVLAFGKTYGRLDNFRVEQLTTPKAFQRAMGGGSFLGQNGPSDGYLGRFSADGKLLAGSLFGGDNSDALVDGILDPGGNVIAIGRTSSERLPSRSPASMLTIQSGPAGLALKMDEVLGEPRYATFLNGFDPVRIFPHPEGGYWMIGSGVKDAPSGGPTDIFLLRIRSWPVDLPRIDSVATETLASNGLRPGEKAIIKGEGFTGSTVVHFGDLDLAPRIAAPGRMEVLLPESTARGIFEVSVETNGRRSGSVRVRIY